MQRSHVVNVLIVTDSQHASQIFGKGSQDGGRAYWAFIPFSVPVCLPYLFLSLPGSEWLFAGSQAESKRMILFRMVRAFCGPRLYRPL